MLYFVNEQSLTILLFRSHEALCTQSSLSTLSASGRLWTKPWEGETFEAFSLLGFHCIGMAIENTPIMKGKYGSSDGIWRLLDWSCDGESEAEAYSWRSGSRRPKLVRCGTQVGRLCRIGVSQSWVLCEFRDGRSRCGLHMRKSESGVEVRSRRSIRRVSRLVLQGTSKCGSNLEVVNLAWIRRPRMCLI